MLLAGAEVRQRYGTLLKAAGGRPIIVSSSELETGWSSADQLIYTLPDVLISRLDRLAAQAGEGEENGGGGGEATNEEEDQEEGGEEEAGIEEAATTTGEHAYKERRLSTSKKGAANKETPQTPKFLC